MNSRQRVLAALNQEAPDRIPLDLGGWVTSIHKIAYENLLDQLGYEDEIKVWDWIQQLPVIKDEVLERLGIDTRYLRPGEPVGDSWQLEKWEGENHYYVVDPWGITRAKPKRSGLYYDIIFPKCPLRDATVEDLEEYPWPDPTDSGFTDGLEERAKELNNGDFAVIGHFNLESWYENCWYMRGYEQWYKDFYKNPDFVDALLNKTKEIHMKFLERVLKKTGGVIDVVMQGDDLATQDGPAMDPKLYRKFIKPHQAEIFDLIKQMTDAKLFYHCCGSVRDLLPDLIDIGIDIINPVQVGAKSMDTEELKKEFGDQIAFWGAIDTQRVLPRGNPTDVRDEVIKRLGDLDTNGGYVLAAVHNIQADVPPENILAMFDTAREY